MSLKERLLEDLKAAMRDKDIVRKNAIQMARAAILQKEKDTRTVLDDEGVIDVISKEVKSRKEALPEYEKSGRQDLVDNLKIEIETLMNYLPKQLSAEEVEAIVKEAISETGAVGKKDMGKVMSAVMPRVKGRADGRLVNQIVSKFLS